MDGWASQVVLVVENLPVNVGDPGDVDSISGLRRSPGRGHANPLQYSCLGESCGHGDPGGLQSIRSQRVGHS